MAGNFNSSADIGAGAGAALDQVLDLELFEDALDCKAGYVVLGAEIGFAGEAVAGFVARHLDGFAEIVEDLAVLGKPVAF